MTCRAGDGCPDDGRMPDAVPSPIPLALAPDHEPLGVRLRDDRALHRIRRGVYCDAGDWGRLRPWDRYLARVHAYAATTPAAVFALESAAALRGLPIFGEPRFVHVFDAERAASDRSGDVVVHTSTDRRAIEQLGPIRVTSTIDTVMDLGRVLPPAFALAVADAGIRSDPACDPHEMTRMVAIQRNARGRRQVRWLCTRADPRAESSGESVSRAVIEWLGFAHPELQHEFRHEGAHDRGDFYWAGVRAIGESDGYGKYPTDPDAARSALLDEKRREDRLRRYVRGFVRWDWADALRVDPLRAKLLAAGVPLVRAPQPAMLWTLRGNRRSF